MNSETIKMTTAQFAKLHGVNKRTLHYYDNIGLFSPCTKGENQYRYYDYLQSMEFEYIRMLKGLNMSIEEIKTYLDNPNETDFLEIANRKTQEIDQEMERLKKSRATLQTKKQQLELCNEIQDMEIRMTECEEMYYLTTPFGFEDNDLQELILHIKDTWDIEQYRMGIGSYISVEKVLGQHFETYDGLFTPTQKGNSYTDVWIRPKGTYLYGYRIGTWEHLPELYDKIVRFAKDRHLHLTGYAYEIGVNDFAIQNMDEYVTQVMVHVEA